MKTTKMRKLIYFLSLLVLFLGACSDSDAKPEDAYFEVNTDYILLKGEGGTAYLNIASNVKWTVFVDNESVPVADLKVTPLSGDGDETIKITYGSEVSKYPYENAELIFYYYANGERVSKEVMLSRKEKVDENDHMHTLIEFVRAEKGFSGTFIRHDGYKIVTDKFLWLDGDMYLINYQYRDSMVDDENKTIKVDLLTEPICIDGPQIGFDNIDKYASNAPFYAFSYDGVAPGFLDAYTLIVPMYFWCYNSSGNSKEMEEELKRHSFTLVYDSNGNSDSNLDLCLLHSISEDEDRQRTLLTMQYRAFNMMLAISRFESENGKKPSKITIEYKVNSSSDRLDLAKTEKYTLDYKFQ